MRLMRDNIDLLIEILFDPTACEDERDDAAVYLGEYNDNRALDALIKICSNQLENPMILDTSGESIGIILSRSNQFQKKIIDKLVPLAKRRAIDYLEAHKPEWLGQIHE